MIFFDLLSLHGLRWLGRRTGHGQVADHGQVLDLCNSFESNKSQKIFRCNNINRHSFESNKSTRTQIPNSNARLKSRKMLQNIFDFISIIIISYKKLDNHPDPFIYCNHRKRERVDSSLVCAYVHDS